MEITHRFEHLDREKAKDAYLDYLRALPAELFVAQDVMMRGALDALLKLQQFGVTAEHCQQMINDVMLSLGMLHGTARNRGIELPNFQPVDAGKTN